VIRCGAWDDAKVLLKGETLEVRWLDGKYREGKGRCGGHEKADSQISLSEAASLLQVGTTTVTSAKKVLREGTSSSSSALLGVHEIAPATFS
jgi:hypothetical protein